jgi:hypothetical protein
VELRYGRDGWDTLGFGATVISLAALGAWWWRRRKAPAEPVLS